MSIILSCIQCDLSRFVVTVMETAFWASYIFAMNVSNHKLIKKKYQIICYCHSNFDIHYDFNVVGFSSLHTEYRFSFTCKKKLTRLFLKKKQIICFNSNFHTKQLCQEQIKLYYCRYLFYINCNLRFQNA